jgi:hypothetical protein
MELTGNEDRPQFDGLCGSGKRKAADSENIQADVFRHYKSRLHRGFISNVGLAAAEEGSGRDDYVDAQEKF